MGKLSTHVLDTSAGLPAQGVGISLHIAEGAQWRCIVTTVTNADGRTDSPLLQAEAMRIGRYRLVFEAGEYFRRRGLDLPEPPFVDQVTIDFGISQADGHYHVPLLVTPWSYSTYRGS
jgi:5-hydroxyisourate hydrolase